MNDPSLLLLAERCSQLAELSIRLNSAGDVGVRGIISALMRASRLQRLCIYGNQHLQVSLDVSTSVCLSVWLGLGLGLGLQLAELSVSVNSAGDVM